MYILFISSNLTISPPTESSSVNLYAFCTKLYFAPLSTVWGLGRFLSYVFMNSCAYLFFIVSSYDIGLVSLDIFLLCCNVLSGAALVFELMSAFWRMLMGGLLFLPSLYFIYCWGVLPDLKESLQSSFLFLIWPILGECKGAS